MSIGRGGFKTRPASLKMRIADSIRPAPIDNLRHVNAVLVGIMTACYLPVPELLLGMGAGDMQTRHPVDHVDCQAETVNLVLDGQLQRSVDVALFLVASHMQVGVVGSAVS